MTQKAYLAIIGLLVLIIIGQGFFLYKNRKRTNRKSYNDILEEPKESFSLLNKLRKKFDKDIDSTVDIFDDNFFNRHSDPFKEMDKI